MKTNKLIEALAEFEVFTLKHQKVNAGREILLYESEGGTCLLEIAGKKGDIKTVTLSMGFLVSGATRERNIQTLSLARGAIKAFFPEWIEGPACILEDCGELADRKVTGGGRRIAYNPAGLFSVSLMDMGKKRINLIIKK